MADMTSTLGLDASEAIASMSKMDALSKSYTTTLDTLATAMNRVGSASSALDNFGSSATKNLNQATSAAQSFTLSWTSIERMLAGRLLGQGIMAKTVIGETVESAMELEKSLQRLSNFSGVDTHTLQGQVVSLSERMGVGIDESLKAFDAAYKSNVGGVEATNVLLESSKNLAKASRHGHTFRCCRHGERDQGLWTFN